MPVLRGIIYARASADKKGRAISVESQVAEGERFFAENGIVVVAVLRDNDMSASRYAKYTRPEYAEALRLLSAGEANLLWTWENSRAQRELDTFVELRKLLIKVGGFWAYDDRIYDMDDPDDRMDTAADAVDSEKESEKTRKRVRRGVASRAHAGLWHGQRVFGYRKVFDPETGEAVAMVEDEVTGPVVRGMVADVIAAKSLSSIAARLNAEGVCPPRGGRWTARQIRMIWDKSRDPVSWAHLLISCTAEQRETAQMVVERVGTHKEHPSWVARVLNKDKVGQVLPRPWTGEMVRSVVTTPTVAGLRVHRKAIVGKGTWEPLITDEQRALVLARLGDPMNARRRDGARVKHLLSGILVCGKCERATNMNPRDGGIYHCPKGCRSRRAAPVEAFVTEAVLARLENAAELFRVSVSSDELSRAAAEATELRARLDGFTDAAADGKIRPEALARIEAKLLPQIEAAERRAQALGTAPTLATIVGPQARQVWAELDVEARRTVLRAVIRPRLLPARPGRNGFDPATVELSWLTVNG